MWDQDWKCTGLRMKKGKAKLKPETETDVLSAGNELQQLEDKFESVMETANLLYKKQPKVPGYPGLFVTFFANLK